MNRKVFFDEVRKTLGPLSTPNVIGFNLVLDEAERRKTHPQHLAYVLATGWWETAKTMMPVEEGFYLGDKAKAFQRKLRYYPYYGRGHVQLTHEENYRKASTLVGVDLVAKPELALDPKISVKVLFDGMERGWFTGKKMADFIDNLDEADKEDLREFSNARRVVNGTDKAVEIGKLALMFEKAIRAAISVGTTQPSVAPKPVKDKGMFGNKSIFGSKTIWGVLITGGFALVDKLGFNFGVDSNQASEIITAGGELFGLLLAAYGRIVATKQIGGK